MNKEFKSFESHKYVEDKEEIEGSFEYKTDLEERIDEIIEKKESLLGEGRSAGVYEDPENKKVCYKSLKLNPSKKIVKGPTPQIVNSVSKEAKLLNLAHSIEGKVEIPQPYQDVEAVFEGDKGKEQSFQAIAMERLNAVSLKDILEDKAEFPMKFIEEQGGQFLYDFFNTLDDFVKKMHDNNLYHRDMHAGNVMINIETGKPGIVDFGAGTKIAFKGTPDDDIYTEKHPSMNKDIRMVKDEHGLTTIRKRFLKHMEPKIKELTKVA